MASPPLTTDIIVQGSISGAKAQNAVFFATDLTPKQVGTTYASKFVITMAFSTTSPIIQISRDAQTTWENLNTGAAFTIGNEYNLVIMAHSGDSINFRASNGSGTTIVYFKVDEGT